MDGEEDIWADQPSRDAAERRRNKIANIEAHQLAPAGKTPEEYWAELTKTTNREGRFMFLIFLDHDVKGAKDVVLRKVLPAARMHQKIYIDTRTYLMDQVKQWRSVLLKKLTVSTLLILIRA